MLSRFSDVLQTAADVLAPPATRLEDFEYHWKLIVNFYQNYDESSKIHIEDTRVPHHLNQMLQLIVEEEAEQQGGTLGPCLESVVQRDILLLDSLTAICGADRPPGARALSLTTVTSLLRRMRQPFLNNVRVYRPLQRMLVQCSESRASPTEKEEVELLLTVCGIVRKEPGLANIFTTPYIEDKTTLLAIPGDVQSLIPVKKYHTPKMNPLFEVEVLKECVSLIASDDVQSEGSLSSCNKYDDHDRFLLVDLLLCYMSSADNQVVLRACEGILIVCSLPEQEIAHLITACTPLCQTLIQMITDTYNHIPKDVDPNDVECFTTTWGYMSQESSEMYKFPGYREVFSFFTWLDFCDTLVKESHPAIASDLARQFRLGFLDTIQAYIPNTDINATVTMTVTITKCLKVVDSTEFLNELSMWLVGEDELGEWTILRALIGNCLTSNHELTLATLKFFECMIEKPSAECIQRLVLCRLVDRRYVTSLAADNTSYDDTLNDVSLNREREMNREVMKQLKHEEHVSEQISGMLPQQSDHDNNYIHKVINSFLLLLPRAILSDPVGVDYEEYIQDAHRHYQAWLDITSTFKWMSEVNCDTTSSNHSYDSRPEADRHLDKQPKQYYEDVFLQRFIKRTTDEDKAHAQDAECFDEGPFLNMLFKLLLTLPDQPYQVNLHLTSIFSKLAMLPQTNIHEYLLNPMLPVAKSTKTLFKVLQELAKRLTLEIPRVKNYKKLIEDTRYQLMSEDPAYDEIGVHNQLIESLIVMEEFCKELAAIAFVKHQHNTSANM